MIMLLIIDNTINYFFSSISRPKSNSCCKVCNSFGCALGTTSCKEWIAYYISCSMQKFKDRGRYKKKNNERKHKFLRLRAMHKL